MLGYEAMVLLITMITIGYWTAIFPTDLVLPDDVRKPNLNETIDIESQYTPVERACRIYYMDRGMTHANFLMKPTP